MPIRTNRGRSAVYRRIWSWPLRSPRHLLVTFILLVIIGATIAIVLSQNNHSVPASATNTSTLSPAQTTDQSTDSNTASSTQATRLTSSLPPPSSAPPAPAALDVATRWAQAWVNHPAGITNQQWLDQLKPYTTDEYLPRMSTVDPSNIPATKVTGPPTVINSTVSSVVVNMPTDKGTLQITVVQTDHQGWRVSSYTQGG